MTATEEVRELGARWVDAELAADVATLDAITTDDLHVVGPFGFVLDKEQWLDRYRSGDFATTALRWDDVAVREHGDTAIAIGTQTQEAAYQGNPSDGQLRTTHVFVRRDDGWRIAGMHLSPMGFAPGS